MASDFLKKKAGVQTSENKPSSFLTRKAQERAGAIYDRYGKDAYGAFEHTFDTPLATHDDYDYDAAIEKYFSSVAKGRDVGSVVPDVPRRTGTYDPATGFELPTTREALDDAARLGERVKERFAPAGYKYAPPQGEYDPATGFELPTTRSIVDSLKPVVIEGGVDENWSRWLELAQKSGLTPEEKKEAGAAAKALDKEIAKVRWNLRADDGEKRRANEYEAISSMLKSKSGESAFAAGLLKSFPFAEKAMSRVNENAQDEELLRSLGYSDEVISVIKGGDNLASASASNKLASGAGEIAGGLLTYIGAGKAVASGTKLIKGFAELAPKVQRAINAAATVGAMRGISSAEGQTWDKDKWDAIQKSQSAIAEEMGGTFAPVEYSVWRNIGNTAFDTVVGAASGYLGSLASNALAARVMDGLMKSKLSPNAIAGLIGASGGFGFAATAAVTQEAANIGKAAVTGQDYTPDLWGIAKNILFMTVYSGLSGYVTARFTHRSSTTSEQDAAAMRKYFTEAELKDPEALRLRYREYAKAYADVRNSTNPNSARAAELAEITNAYNMAKIILAGQADTAMRQEAQSAKTEGRAPNTESEAVKRAIALLNVEAADNPGAHSGIASVGEGAAGLARPSVTVEAPVVGNAVPGVPGQTTGEVKLGGGMGFREEQSPSPTDAGTTRETTAEPQTPGALTPAFRQHNVNQVMEAAEAFGENGKAAIAMYTGETDPVKFFGDFARAYKQGKDGAEITYNTPWEKAAYEAGAADSRIKSLNYSGEDGIVEGEAIAAKLIQKAPAGMPKAGVQIGDSYYLGTVAAVAKVGKAVYDATEDVRKVAAENYKRLLDEATEKGASKPFIHKYTDTKGKKLTLVVFEPAGGFQVCIDRTYYNYFKGYDFYLNPSNTLAPVRVADKNGDTVGFIMPMRVPHIDTSGGTETSDNGGVPKAEPSAPAKSEPAKPRTASERLAEVLIKEYISTGKTFTSTDLYRNANNAFGGSMAEGTYTVKEAYDALELAVNQYLLYDGPTRRANTNDVNGAVRYVEYIRQILKTLPTQTKRTEEQQSFQQFSTPPNIAYLAAWVANVTKADSVLEPSAGIGGLAVFPKAWGASVTVNELSKRRLGVLKSMGFDRVFNENAEQLDNILPDDVRPTVVIMNPPFSSTAGRTATNKTSNAKKHIEQALARLEDGGRLVAILGKGMSDNSSFSSWWDELRGKYSIRANISIDGGNYRKYGTTWDVQLVVIDKTGPQSGKTLTGEYSDLGEIPGLLEGIRNDRRAVEKGLGAGGGRGAVGDDTSGRNRLPESRPSGSVERPDGKAAVDTGAKPLPGDSGKRNGTPRQGGDGKGVSRNDGVGGRDITVSGDVPVQSGDVRPDRPQSQPPLQVKPKKAKSDNGVYAEYEPAEMPIKGQKHPAPLVESAAMAAVAAPKAVYVPNLPKSIVDKGLLSAAQLENVVYAGQAHSQTLPDGARKGYFIGDGTGVGKGRQISGIILDNFRNGREKAVWVSKNNPLYVDAVRDWVDIGGSKDAFIPGGQSKIKAGAKIPGDKGILFTTYSTLSSASKDAKASSRLDQLVDWLGEDFDGVIAFDEAHNMGNLLGKKGARGKTKGSEKARAGVELQKRLPNARIVYVSATGATDVNELAYATRLGLWGRGTAFRDVNDFVSQIGSSGLAAMELVARDMKAMGVYLARSISYDGVTYDTLQHDLSPVQNEIYNTMSKAWQITLRNMNEALNITNGKLNGNAKSAARSAYYGAMQRFYNQVLTSMSMPSVIEDIKRELAAGHSCVIQLVNTNEAETDRQLVKIKETGEDLDSLDLTPRGTLLGYLENSFPIYAYEEYTDDNGNTQSRPVKDSEGNPVIDRQAKRLRDDLIAQINQMSIPDGPLEMLFDAFSTEGVAEVTGRSRRVVPKKNERGETVRVEERRTPNHTAADVDAFQNGDKRILVFSDAGGTGKSYHADRRAKNQQQRVHYLVQPGWSASIATQGFGRTHRSNQVNTPAFKLVTTNIMGQKRFVSTIARRLDQLGALTKGQRETGSGMFSDKDNLESDLARDALRSFYENLGKNRLAGLNGKTVLEKLGLLERFSDEYGAFKLDENTSRDMGVFLNRILALEVDEQNAVFAAFYRIFEDFHDRALKAGTLDLGMENVRADKIEIIDNKVIRTDDTGASTNYVQAKTYNKPRLLDTLDKVKAFRGEYQGLYRTDEGNVRAVYRVADKTNNRGEVQKMFRMQTPVVSKYGTWNEDTLKSRAVKLTAGEASAWAEEVKKAPEYEENTIHMLTGALLPIWNRLPQEGSTRAMRIVADDGSQYLGRVIPASQIDLVLRNLGAGARTKESYTPAGVMDSVLKGKIVKLSYDRIKLERRRVSGEQRIEISGNNVWHLPRQYSGIITENINYNYRYFIPTNEQGREIIAQLIKDNPVLEVVEDNEVDEYRGTKNAHITADMSDAERYEMLKGKSLTVPMYDAEKAKDIPGEDYSALERIGRTKAYSILKRIGEQFGVFKSYHNEDIDISFEFSRRKLYESVNKQGGNEFQTYARLMTCFDAVTKNAVGIEAHSERYDNKASRLSQMYVLAGAFGTETGVVPVLLEVKTFTDGTDNSLHVIISLSEIERSRIIAHTPDGENADGSYTLPASNINIADLFANVNAADGKLLKYIPDGFLDAEQLAAKSAAIQEQADYDARKNRERYGRDEYRGTKDGRWDADRVGEVKEPMSITDILAKIKHDFGINITRGQIRKRGSLGQYNRHDSGIRSRNANDLPTIAHELGHHFDKKYDLRNNLDATLKGELEGGLSAEMKLQYPKKKWHTEGLAEFMRKFLQNSEGAAKDYPKFTPFFRSVLSAEDLKHIDELADEVNAYYSLDADTATSSIKFSEEKARDFRSFIEQTGDALDGLYQAWVDAWHGIKLFDRAAGTNTYKLASNSAYADAVAGAVLTGDLTDINGQRVGPGLTDALKGIDVKNKETYRLFGEYLVVKHGPFRIKEGMRVFADDRKNTVEWMEGRSAELEAQHPEFVQAAEKLYKFQTDFLQTWGVDTGLVSQDSFDEWMERWDFYVPLNRKVDGRAGAKRGFANQTSTIKRAHGSGLDIVHPVDGIVNNVVKMVNAGIKNNVMAEITKAAKDNEGLALWLEKVPMPIKSKTFDVTGLKKNLSSSVAGLPIRQEDIDAVTALIGSLDDILTQFGRGKAVGDVVSVLRNGELEYWKINDPLLLSSVTNMSPQRLPAWLEAYGRMSRFMTSNITGMNVIWSIFSNFPRDLMTYFTYSTDKNPVHIIGGIGSAYINKFKGMKADPLYLEYLAMGGARTSAYTADKDLERNIRKKLSGDKSQWLNPLEWVEFMADMVELGPRFSYYKLLRAKGLTPAEAFYESTDVTVNFRRGGVNSRSLNKVIPFFNAGLQGLDKFARWISAAEAPREQRGKRARGRGAAFFAATVALGVLQWAINSVDDEDRKDYAQLSNYTKNTYWCIPLGDGKYFTIPKPRELAVLTSFTQSMLERFANENTHAFDEFWNYTAEQFFPNVVSDLAQGDIPGAIGSLGIIGIGAYMMANRDFLGRPIVSASMQYLESKDQYNARTSKIAYWMGQAFGVSPAMADYFFQNTLGGWWKVQKALFPVGDENIDYTLGVQNQYVKDNQYSTDLINRLYDASEAAQKRKKSNPDDAAAAVTAKWYASMTDFYSNFNKISKLEGDTQAARNSRQIVLDMIAEFEKNMENGYTTPAQRAVESYCEKAGDTSLMPSVMQTTVKDDNGRGYNLSVEQYIRYQLEYNTLYWEYVEDAGRITAATLRAAKVKAGEDAKANALYRLGFTSEVYTENREMRRIGLDTGEYIQFKAGLDLANDDGSLKQEEIIDVILAIQGLSDEERYYLFHTRYESDKNNPWA